MIVGAYVEHAAPEHPAGAEWSLQDLMAWLVTQGHEARIVASKGWRRVEESGVKITSRADEVATALHFQECDVMLTQLDASAEAQSLAFTYQTPLVQLIHSSRQLEQLGVFDSCRALTVFNADHVAADCEWWPGSSMVLHPPIDHDRVRATPGACCTLVNMSHNKGGPALVRLAEMLEDVPFMGVQGAYGDQALGPEGFPGTEGSPTPTGLPANLRVFPPMERIAEGVFRFTRVLLVLSMDETYGRVAGEALVSGIPVVAALTPGTFECLGSSGAYVGHRDDLRGLSTLIRHAYSEWDEWSAKALARAEANRARQDAELLALLKRLEEIVRNPPEMIL